MSSEWTFVATPRRTPQPTPNQSGAADAEKFLRTYKISQCRITERHDWKECLSWHNDGPTGDRRRDYYKKPYTPNETLNLVEKCYHPDVFRMQMCRNNPCPRGKLCSYAHRAEELRYKCGASSSADVSAECSAVDLSYTAKPAAKEKEAYQATRKAEEIAAAATPKPQPGQPPLGTRQPDFSGVVWGPQQAAPLSLAQIQAAEEIDRRKKEISAPAVGPMTAAPTTSAAGFPAKHRDGDVRSDSQSERSPGGLSSQTDGGCSSSTAKGSAKKAARPPNAQQDAQPPIDYNKDLDLSFVYQHSGDMNADPRDRLLKLLNPGARPDKMKINRGEREFDNARCRAIRYLFYQKGINIDQGWDQENTWWDEQTAVHFAAQCSSACLKQLALCWGPTKVGEIAARYAANGHNALHLATHTNQLGCVNFLLGGDVGTAFLKASKELCTSLVPRSVTGDADDFCPHGVNAFTLYVLTERQVEREKLRQENEVQFLNEKLTEEQCQRVRYLPARVVSCNKIGTRTALSIAAMGWFAAADPSSGRPYYYHQACGATQWEPPPGYPGYPRHTLGEAACPAPPSLPDSHSGMVKTLLKEGANPNFYVAGPIRTRRCKYQKSFGRCDNGSECQFAHRDSDLGTPRPGDVSAVVPYVSAIRSFLGAERKAARDRMSAAMVWTCRSCTYENSDGARVCGTCGEVCSDDACSDVCGETRDRRENALLSDHLTKTLSLLAQPTQRERMQGSVSALLKEELQGGVPSLSLTKLWAANLLDVEHKYDVEFVKSLTEVLWPQLVAGEAAATEIFWTRLEAKRALAVSNIFHPDTLATLAIKAHRHETTFAEGIAPVKPEAVQETGRQQGVGGSAAASPAPKTRTQTCTLLTEVLRRFPGSASTAAADVKVTPEGDPNQPQNTALNIAVEFMNCAAVEELLALNPPASFLRLDGLQCSAVGTAIAQLKNLKQGNFEKFGKLQALGTIIAAFAKRAEKGRYPNDWADIRAPIVEKVDLLQKKFTSEKDRKQIVAPWRRLLDLWPAGEVEEPLGSLPGALPAVAPPAAAPPTATHAAVASVPPLPLGPVSRSVTFEMETTEITSRKLQEMGFGKSSPPVGMSRFKATNASLLFRATWQGRQVVVKQLNPSVISEEEKEEMRHKRYWQEFKFHQRLKNKNIVELLECYWNDNTENGAAAEGIMNRTLHLVFDWFPLGCLGDVLQSFRFAELPRCGESRKRMEHETYAFYYGKSGGELVHTCSPKFIHSILLQISRALGYLHREDTGHAKVIHRDLKTENVLIEALPNGAYCAKLTDFGLARHYDRMTRTIGLKSTMQISAPEMFSPETPKYDEIKVDVYAFGHLIWEVFSLQKPFSNVKSADELNGLIQNWNMAKRGIVQEESAFRKACDDARRKPNAAVLLPFLEEQHTENLKGLNKTFKEAGDKARPSPIVPMLPHHLGTWKFGKELLKVMQECLDFEPHKRPTMKDINGMMELQARAEYAPELYSAPDFCTVLETLGSLVKQKYISKNPTSDHKQFMRMLNEDKNKSLLKDAYAIGGYQGYLLPRLANEAPEAYKAAAEACENTLKLPQGMVGVEAGATSSGLDRTCLPGMLICVRNLVAHGFDKAYLHDIGWDRARLRYELGNRFSNLAVSLAVDFRKARNEAHEEWAHDVQAAVVDSIEKERKDLM